MQEPARPPEPSNRKRLPRSLQDWSSGVEQQIREAQARGDFDGIPLGSPLPTESWGGEWGLAHHVLKQAGETLPWIAANKEIEQQRAKLRCLLDTAVASRSAWLQQHDGERRRRAIRTRYLTMAAELDTLMGEFNLIVPIRRLDKGRFPAHVAQRTFDEACPVLPGDWSR